MRILLSSICVESGTDLQLALYYLKSYLLKQNNPPKVEVYVFNEYEGIADIINKIKIIKPEVLGFSCYIWNIDKILRVSRRLKNINPGLKIILGGPEASPQAQKILAENKCIDVVVRGEGEEAFAQVIHNMPGGNLAGVPGITFRDGRRIIHNPGRKVLADLDKIPSPYLTGVINLQDKGIIDVPLETTRGCAYGCYYCYYHKNFGKVRNFSLARVKRELKLILASKPREVYLMDATFNANPDRAKKILKIFIRYNKVSSFHVELRAELIDEEMAALLRKANAFNIEIGIQSINPKALKAINRPFNKEKFREGIRLLNKYGLFYEIQLIDCLPYQGYQDFKRSLDWLYSLHPVKVVVFRLAVLAGTQLRKMAKDYGIVYDRCAPYYAYKSAMMPKRDIDKIDNMRFAMERLYDSQVFQDTLYALKDRAGLKISSIFEDWVVWERQFRRRPAAYPDFLNRKSPEFLKFLCLKHKKIKVYKELLPKLEEKLAEFVRAYER